MVKSTSYLKKLNGVIEKISDKYDISEDKLENLLDTFFKTLKSYITDERMPTIKIIHLGTFRPTIGKINSILKRGFNYYRKGSLKRETLVKRVQTVWPIKQRLIKEKNKEHTWKEWRDKKM